MAERIDREVIGGGRTLVDLNDVFQLLVRLLFATQNHGIVCFRLRF
jgi:hypothetical protein